MPSLLHTILLLALLTIVLAVPAPAPAPIQKRSFKVERVPNPNFKRHVNHVRAPGAGTRALIKAYRKYNIALPRELSEALAASNGATPGVGDFTDMISQLTGGNGGMLLGDKAKANKAKTKTTAAATTAATGGAVPAAAAANSSAATNSSATTGTVVTTPESGDVEYLSPVVIGGQTINMDFDSGSSDLWVFNTGLAAKSSAGHTLFDTTKSTSFKTLTGATYSISYGDGSGSAGIVGTDTVAIGGVSVTSQAVELPTAVSGSFITDTQSNGLVGLAYSKLNTVKPTQQKTFFDNASKNLALPVFTADLRPGAPGAYEFGAIDTTKFNGTMQWAAVNTTQGFWQFSTSSFTVDGGAAQTTPGGQAIADTGTTLMLASAAMINAYYSKVQGAVNNATVGGVTFPCSATLPDMTFDVGGSFQATVKGKDINFAPVDASGTSKSIPSAILSHGVARSFS
jgi:hypothetical protein